MSEEFFYAEVFESTRFKGTRLLEFREFTSEAERDKFITDYNQILFETCEDGTPEVYTMAQTGSYYNIMDFKIKKRNSDLQDETFSK